MEHIRRPLDRDTRPEPRVARPNKKTRLPRRALTHLPQVLLVLVDRIAPQGYYRGRCTGEAEAGAPGPQGDNATERRIVNLDEQLKQLIKELGDAINESLSESERIAEVIGNIKHAGYDVFLVLEATIGFNRREESIKKEPLKSVTNRPGRAQFTTQDTKFLKALKISVDEERH